MKTHIFDKGHNEKGYQKILKWLDDEEVYPLDLMAIVCAKFSLVPQVMRNEITFDKTQIMLQGIIYEITINKVLYNNEKTETDIPKTMERGFNRLRKVACKKNRTNIMEKKNKKGTKQMATKEFYHDKCGKFLSESDMLIGNGFIYCKHCKIPMLAVEDSYVFGKEFDMSKIEHATLIDLMNEGYLI